MSGRLLFVNVLRHAVATPKATGARPEHDVFPP